MFLFWAKIFPIKYPWTWNSTTHISIVITPGIKSLVHDVQLKRQKEIRDMMKKKREKAVLVDRISRWLFPTSFILLNIVYWALFGDHGLWWSNIWISHHFFKTESEIYLGISKLKWEEDRHSINTKYENNDIQRILNIQH